MANFVIRNQTVEKLVLEGDAGVLKLPPLHRTRIGKDPLEHLGLSALKARQDNVVAWELEPIRSSRLLVTAGCAATGIAAVLAGITSSMVTGRLTPLIVACAAAMVLLVFALVVLRKGASHGPGQRHGREDETFQPSPVRGDHWELARDLLIGSSHGAVLVLVLVLGIVAPGAAIYYGTELSTVVTFHSWRDVSVAGGPEVYGIVVGRILLLLTVILVSLFPALMYFQFDREKLNTLIDRWLHAVFRLDPTVQTVADVDAKYGRRVEEYYGAWLGAGIDPPRKRARSRSPLVVATLLIGTGWILVLLNGGPTAEDPSSLPGVEELFRPALTPMTAGFLGAYFLGVQVTLRGYVRGDLRPKTYNVISVRIILAVIAAWLLQGLFGSGDVVLAASFISGFLPNTVVRRIREAAGKLSGSPRKAGDGDARDEFEDTPLTRLDGMDIYERTRLEEEGITGVQALARHDLIDLILSSRIPVSRLIDWLDQALLYQHASTLFVGLRERGVRTATDFLQVASEADALKVLVDDLGSDSLQPSLQPALLAAALRNDEWLTYVTCWRSHDTAALPPIRRYDRDGAVSVQRPACRCLREVATDHDGRPPRAITR